MTSIVNFSKNVFLRFPLSPKATFFTSITINSLALFYHEKGHFSNIHPLQEKERLYRLNILHPGLFQTLFHVVNKKEAGTKVQASQLSLDCRARRSG